MQQMGGRGCPALRSTPGPWPQAPSQRAGWHKCVPTAECPDKHCPWTGGLVSTNKGRCVQPWVRPLVSTPGQGSVPRSLGADTSPQGSFPAPCPTTTHKPHQEPSQHPACPSCGGRGSQPTAPKGTRLRHHRGKSGGWWWKGRPPSCVCVRASHAHVYTLGKPVHLLVRTIALHTDPRQLLK